jgi:putative ABC transport system permease protein
MQTIPFVNLLYLLIPLVFVWYFYNAWTGDKKDIIYSTFRMIIQLLIIGYVLLYLFEEKNSLIGFFIILFMALVSAFITLRNTKDKSKKHYLIIFFAIMISGVIHLFLIINFVLDLEDFYTPRFVIPIAGMIFANTMNAISLAVERFEQESTREDFITARKIAFKAAMIPQINSLLAVGLVAIPGMMTGQILSGIDPLIAVRYQILIMSMTLSTAGISVIIYFLLKQRQT